MIGPKRISELSKKERVKLLQGRKMRLSAIMDYVKDIVEDVRRRGDEALREYTLRFDGIALEDLQVSRDLFERAYDVVSSDIIKALETSADNIAEHHSIQMPKSCICSINGPILTAILWRPLRRVGIYVPGGRAKYPSTLLMAGVPARMAGVREVYVATPPRPVGSFPVDPVILVAADIAKVTSVFTIGGPQAIAAFAFGTETIPKVDKIVGPGNIYVNAAKALVSQDVAIDMIAGPSEILIIADDSATPTMIALDMMAQGEHDPNATCVLISLDERLARAVKRELEVHAEGTARRSLEDNGAILIADDLDEAISFSNAFAPEHLELCLKDPWSILRFIENAGSISLGERTPVALGDYITGCNHILPTSGLSRVRGALGVYDFLKPISVQMTLGGEELRDFLRMAITLAEVEGLKLHAESLRRRVHCP